LVLYIERFGSMATGYWRRLAEIFELEGVEGGRPVGQTLFRWQEDGDRFERRAGPRQFGQDDADLQARAQVIEKLAASDSTTEADVADAVQRFRQSRQG